MNILTAHPKLVTFGIGLAFGTIDHNQAFAAPSYGCDEGVGI
jgi:hypothetical protein